MSLTSKVTWPALFRRAFEEAIISHNILTGFIATEIYPWNPLAIPVSAFLPYQAFNEGSMQSVTYMPEKWIRFLKQKILFHWRQQCVIYIKIN